MAVYFQNFPKTTHNGNLVIDITRRVQLKNTVLSNPFVFLPYTIQQDEDPEDIALYYYGSVRYTWLVYFSVGLIDPYFQWPLTTKQFERYIINKYQQQSGVTGREVLEWSMNETIGENIVHYVNNNGDKISRTTFSLDSNIIASEWTPIRVFDYENQLNEQKRAIELVDSQYAAQAEEELKELLNDRLV